NNSYRWSPLAVILIIILGCVSLPDAKHTKASETSTTETAPHISLRRVWSSSYPITNGEPSPDGRYLSYTDWETGDLAICEIATGKKHHLTNKGSWDESDEFAFYSRWSPDGKQIVYDWFNDNFMELRIIGIDGSKPQILYSADEMEWARVYDWSPVGEQILACLLGKDGEGKIALVSAADGSVRIMKTFEKHSPGNMSFSPDGSFIVYSHRQKEGSLAHDISVMSVDGSREIPLIKHPAHDFVLGWAPDGKNILFASDRTGILGIWMVAVFDGRPQGAAELVKPNAGQFQPLGLTKEGSYYYVTSKGSNDVYVATLDPQTGTILAPPKKAIQRYEGSILAAAYSPDGKYLAYIYSHSRGKTLCIRSLETGQEQEFPFKPDSIRRFSSLRWSPDGRSILVSANDEKDNAVIYGVNVQTGQVKPIVPSHTGEWSGDGKAIFYVRNDRNSKISKILFRDIETGRENVFYRSPSDEFIFNIALSPDGQSLALRRVGPTSLKIVPVAGGEPRELPEFEKVATIHKPIAWTADSKYILFSGNEPGGGKHPLYRISVDSGKTEKLGLKMNRYFALSAHPDGQRILISGSESASESEVWVMENFLPGVAAAKLDHQPNFRKIWIPTKPGNGVLSPDGKKLAFVSEGSLWVVPVHGKVSPDIAGEPVRLTEPMGAWDVASLLAWSADGNWIAFNASDEKEDAIYVVRSSGGVPKKVPVEPRLRNSVYNYRLSLSPDGKVLAFSS
ncbi:MAG: PD40 domain-containing protein, partial [Desulfobacteraceae bacterium]|nr:PD40 domain-containing protein [Desulfobacteraceae bacterium]